MKPTLIITGSDHFKFMLAQSLAPAAVYMLAGVGDNGAKLLATNADNRCVEAYGTEEADLPREVHASRAEDFDIVAELLGSSYPLLMMDRQPTVLPKSILMHQAFVLRWTLHCINILRRHRIERVVSCSTPHQTATYLMFMAAKLMGLERLVVERSPLPHRYWIIGGFGDIPPARSPSTNVALSKRTREMLEHLKANGESPTDDLARQRTRYGGQSYSAPRELAQFLRGIGSLRPWRPVHVLTKNRLWRRYQHLCRTRLPVRGSKRLTFFMHYQPERTTLPEAGLFVLQHFALAMLATVMPDDYEIVVREHPSTWLLPLQYGGRTLRDYDLLASIQRLRFEQSTSDVSSVIDCSTIVATCTGKIGLQALIRDKPVFAFGYPAYANHPLCRRIENRSDLEAAVSCLGALTSDQDAGASIGYLQAIEGMSREEPPASQFASHRDRRLAALTNELDLLCKSSALEFVQ